MNGEIREAVDKRKWESRVRLVAGAVIRGRKK
jgi:hypothetical protein